MSLKYHDSCLRMLWWYDLKLLGNRKLSLGFFQLQWDQQRGSGIWSILPRLWKEVGRESTERVYVSMWARGLRRLRNVGKGWAELTEVVQSKPQLFSCGMKKEMLAEVVVHRHNIVGEFFMVIVLKAKNQGRNLENQHNLDFVRLNLTLKACIIFSTLLLLHLVTCDKQ